MFPPDTLAPVILSCFFWSDAAESYVRAVIEDADNETETAQVVQEGTCFVQTISFEQIATVRLSHGFEGLILKDFGPPRPHRPVFATGIPTRFEHWQVTE